WTKATQFDLTPFVGVALATTGGAIPIMSGLTMVFTVLDPTGTNQQVRCSLPIAVKPTDSGSDILGMDQLVSVNAKVRWDPSSLTGRRVRLSTVISTWAIPHISICQIRRSVWTSRRTP